MAATTIRTQCCIVGGGPAGLMLAHLLARGGVSVVVLEKHGDFLRDFRGDTIHPSTLELMHELGLLDEFLKLPHQKVDRMELQFGEERLWLADFRHLPVQCPYIAFMPQWDFLDFLARQAARWPGFVLRRRAEAIGLIQERGRCVGVRAIVDGAACEVRADLVVGCDGRHSTVRGAAELAATALGAPMDVLWFSLPRRPEDPSSVMGRFDSGRVFIAINRGDQWQLGYVVPKGGATRAKAQGIEAIRLLVAELAPWLADRVQGLGSVDDLKLLTVGVERLELWWKPGVLCIGDAAHTMSPVGGIGINLAIQDAVAAGNRLAVPLREGHVSDADLAAIQARRSLPTRATQALQVAIQDRVIAPALSGGSLRAPWPMRVTAAVPWLRRLPARAIGLGLRRERVLSPAVPIG